MTQKSALFPRVADSLIYSCTVPVAGVNSHYYYRLRLMDGSNAQTFSPWDTVALPVHVNSVAQSIVSSLTVAAFPNPCNAEFALNASETGEWQLTDPLGRTVLTSGAVASSYRVSTRDLSSGAYHLRFTSRDGVVKTALVIVQH